MDDARDSSARGHAELSARVSYGRLLALLASRSRDIAAAEDALGDAFATALQVWPKTGTPENPDAWLLTAARRNLGHAARASKVREMARGTLETIYEEFGSRTDFEFPDERVRLLFVCAHPAIDVAVRTPLMLQTVLGIDASTIATAFVVAPSAMSQRLVRAKAKIRDAGLSFEPPDRSALPERLQDVLSAIYAAYGAGWELPDHGSGADTGLAGEAIYLGRLICALLPDEPEAKGLLALMLYCEARKGARRDDSGRFIPLGEQDPRLWRRDLIIEAEGLLTTASRHMQFGRFQCEAAIQSVHCQRPFTGATNWTALRQLYELLAHHSPTVGVLTSRAAVIAEAGDPRTALDLLDALAPSRVAAYQPYWATRARVLDLLARPDKANAARRNAISLTADEATRAHLAMTVRDSGSD